VQHVARFGGIRSAYSILFVKAKAKRLMSRWEENIKIVLKKYIVDMGWKVRDQSRVFVNTVMNLKVL
jgi:hypothetical protein